MNQLAFSHAAMLLLLVPAVRAAHGRRVLPPPCRRRRSHAHRVPPNGAIFQVSSGYAAALQRQSRARGRRSRHGHAGRKHAALPRSTSANTKRDGSSQACRSAGPFINIPSSDLNASARSSFKGAGDASQTSSLPGDLTVTIAEVRPNGTALVRGEKLHAAEPGRGMGPAFGHYPAGRYRSGQPHRIDPRWPMPASPIRARARCSRRAARAGCRGSSTCFAVLSWRRDMTRILSSSSPLSALFAALLAPRSPNACAISASSRRCAPTS